jgi:hypothetical protein
MRKTQDISGMKFGRYTVLCFSHEGNRRAKFWLCRCDCGIEKPVNSAFLKNGLIKSCGCLMREQNGKRIKAASTTHGMSKSSEYRIWQLMIERCRTPNNPAYPRYGGRGIFVCERWLESFENFYADMGPRPPGLQLDRENNDKGYSKNNCRWTTYKINNSNRRDTIRITFGGKTMCLKDWARELGLEYLTLYSRIKRGWPVEKALTEPRRVQ